MFGRKDTLNVHASIQARLSDYLDNQLAPAERAQLETHLHECADCRAALESLRWTIALVKQAPAPALRRSFTLPVPAQRSAQPAFGFGLARLATALATLLLIVIVGVDAITQLGGSSISTTAFAPQAAKEAAPPPAAPTQARAAAPQPTSAPKPAVLPTILAQATEAPQATQAPRPTSAPPTMPPAPAPLQPTMVAPAAVPPAFGGALPTTVIPFGLGGAPLGTPTSKSANEGMSDKARSLTPAPRSSVDSAITATATIPAPTVTLAPTATLQPSPAVVAQARGEPTKAAQPTRAPAAIPQPLASPLRIAEVGLLFLVVFFATLTILLRKKK